MRVPVNAPSDSLELVGSIVAEKYLVESVVGEGGFAIVYRANHQIWNRPVALKVFKALDEVPPEHRDRLLKEFVQEGALLAELSEKSAAIVQARDVGMLTTKRGAVIPYMVLEWLEGRSLEDIIAAERASGTVVKRSVAQAMALLQPVAQALALAHERGIAHRDVKPANVFVLGDPYAAQPAVKLLDFGIAKVVQDAQKMSGSFTKTSGQITSFTPAYGAPEQFSRDYGSTGPWTDVFALTLIFVELLTAREPLGGDTLTQLAFAAVDTNKRPTPRTLGADIPDSIEGVFNKALSVRVDNRFKTAGEFWAALSAAARGEDWEIVSGKTVFASDGGARVITSPSPSSGNVPQPAASAAPAPPVKRTGLIVGAGMATAALLGAVGFLFARGNGREGADKPAASASVVAAPPDAAAAAPPKPKCPDGMLFVPGGPFRMGSNPLPGVPEHETPQHPVRLSPFCMDQYEVTVAKYMDCAKSGKCNRIDGDAAVNEWKGITPAQKKTYDPLCNLREPAARPDHPVNCINWADAFTYCRENAKTLPTEAQWEFAARGNAQLKFPWGDDPDFEGRLNACGSECLAWGKANDPHNFPKAMYEFSDGAETTARVGMYKKGKSPFGIEDMSGNVFEWVEDFIGPYPTEKGGKALEEQVDPRGPQDGAERVVRGGGWNSLDLFWLRPTYRWSRPATKFRSHGIGFRCAAPTG